MPADTLSPAAERQRRYRRRLREGVRVFRGDIPPDVIAALVKNCLIGVDETADPLKLGDALTDLADCWTQGTLQPAKK